MKWTLNFQQIDWGDTGGGDADTGIDLGESGVDFGESGIDFDISEITVETGGMQIEDGDQVSTVRCIYQNVVIFFVTKSHDLVKIQLKYTIDVIYKINTAMITLVEHLNSILVCSLPHIHALPKALKID